MKHVILFLLLFVSVYALAQVKKPQTQVRKTTAPKLPSINPADYDYYFVVYRTAKDPRFTAANYTLTDNPNSYQTVILDIRTGKEVAWWPYQKTVFSKLDQQLYLYTLNTMSAFKPTGEKVYAVNMFVPESFPIQNERNLLMHLSAEWNKVVFPYNKDIWVADFNRKNGSFSSPKQVTQAGIFSIGCAYLKDKYLITSATDSYVINIDNGKFTPCESYLESDVPKGYRVYTGVSHNTPALWDIIGQKPYHNNPNEWYFGWLNEDHTKYLIGAGEVGSFGRTTNTLSDLLYFDNQTGMTKTLNWNKNVFKEHSIFLLDGPLHGSCIPSFDKYENFSFSPNRNFFFLSASPQSTDPDKYIRYKEVYVYDIANLTERKVNIKLEPQGTNTGYSLQAHYRVSWLDDEHLIIDARVGDTLNGTEITLANKGAYVYDLATNQSKKLTAYNIDFGSFGYQDNYWLKVVQFPKANRAIFQANNYIYIWNRDSSEVKQLAQYPGIYTLGKKFIDEYID